MKVLVTAGPTREPIDPVRYISNRSSGRMGFAIAAAAAHRGHQVRLVAGPVALATPRGVARTDVITAADMLRAVRRNLAWCDALVMVAAVADWRPCRARTQKLKKTRRRLVLELEPTTDILRALGRVKGRRVWVGFAAETRRLDAEARRKLREKRLDMIVANDVSARDAGFEVQTNRAVIFTRSGERIALPLMSKARLAGLIVRRLEQIRATQGGRA